MISKWTFLDIGFVVFFLFAFPGPKAIGQVFGLLCVLRIAKDFIPGMDRIFVLSAPDAWKRSLTWWRQEGRRSRRDGKK